MFHRQSVSAPFLSSIIIYLFATIQSFNFYMKWWLRYYGISTYVWKYANFSKNSKIPFNVDFQYLGINMLKLFFGEMFAFIRYVTGKNFLTSALNLKKRRTFTHGRKKVRKNLPIFTFCHFDFCLCTAK